MLELGGRPAGAIHLGVVSRGIGSPGASSRTSVLLPVWGAPVTTTAGITRPRSPGPPARWRGRTEVTMACMMFIHDVNGQARCAHAQAGSTSLQPFLRGVADPGDSETGLLLEAPRRSMATRSRVRLAQPLSAAVSLLDDPSPHRLNSGPVVERPASGRRMLPSIVEGGNRPPPPHRPHDPRFHAPAVAGSWDQGNRDGHHRRREFSRIDGDRFVITAPLL